MKEKIFPNVKVLVIISAVAIASTLSLAFLNEGGVDTLAYDGIQRAAIIDQLSAEMPNPSFTQKATQYLETAGYQVDNFTSNDITVDFYKELPSMNYQFIVIRTHSIGKDVDNTNSVMLFTGERYTEDKYIGEQLIGHVQKGSPLVEVAFLANSFGESEWVEMDGEQVLKMSVTIEDNTRDEFFVITPKLVKEAMIGKFPETTFILGGCETLSNPSLAEALIERGASKVVGWDNTVSSANNDTVMLRLLEETLVKNVEIKDAIDELSDSSMLYPPYMAYPANFTYYTNDKI